jgi:hypothetical protein
MGKSLMAKKNVGGRPAGPKNRCSGAWTEARYNSFIKSTLRRACVRWGPIQECLKNARVRRGWYLCASCKEEVPATIVATLKNGKKKRVKNAIADHIKPIINPATGFTTWDSCIENMFCELDNLQCVCHACHEVKCQEEKDITKERNAKEKLDGK